MNDRAERLRREVWRWLRLAREDLAAARHLANAAHLPHRVACLLAQQAAEKAVKAVLVAEDMDPPKLHDLRRLLERCASPIMAGLDEPGLEDLSRWSIAGRYPADVDGTQPRRDTSSSSTPTSSSRNRAVRSVL
jgi:HEPN domain-containing protein